jgi:ABC-2 type transport system ATP-binding protein
VSRDDGALILRVPADGTPQSVKAVLDRLGQQALGADSITVHTPDLDDVFFALTGQTQHEQEIPA